MQDQKAHLHLSVEYEKKTPPCTYKGLKFQTDAQAIRYILNV